MYNEARAPADAGARARPWGCRGGGAIGPTSRTTGGEAVGEGPRGSGDFPRGWNPASDIITPICSGSRGGAAQEHATKTGRPLIGLGAASEPAARLYSAPDQPRPSS